MGLICVPTTISTMTKTLHLQFNSEFFNANDNSELQDIMLNESMITTLPCESDSVRANNVSKPLSLHDEVKVVAKTAKKNHNTKEKGHLKTKTTKICERTNISSTLFRNMQKKFFPENNC